MLKRALSGRQLLTYLDAEVRSGQLNAGTASSRRSAVREVLQIAFGERWESAPFSSSDLADLLADFDRKHEADFTPETRSSYRSNFKRTVELCLASSNTDASGTEWMMYRFPIRDGVVVEISLPVDLAPAEAKRLSALITALPVEG